MSGTALSLPLLDVLLRTVFIFSRLSQACTFGLTSRVCSLYSKTAGQLTQSLNQSIFILSVKVQSNNSYQSATDLIDP